MEERIIQHVAAKLALLAQAVNDAQNSLQKNAIGAVIGALLDEDRRIIETIQLCKILRDFKG